MINKLPRRFLIQQVVIPDYRMRFFLDLTKALDAESLEVIAGVEDFNITPKSSELAWKHFLKTRNTFLFRRKFLWQNIVLKSLSYEKVILNANTRIISNWAILIIRRLLFKKTYLWGHTIGKNKAFNILKLLFISMGNAYICYTNDQKSGLIHSLPSHQVFSAPNACLSSDECFSYPQAEENLDTIVYVGRLISEKKAILLIKAFKYICENNLLDRDIKLKIVGEGYEGENLKRFVANAKLSNIQFVGHINSTEKLREIYSKAFASVSPGYVGLSATQSFAFGVPMAVSRDEKHSPEIEACIESYNTKYFDTDNYESLASVIFEFHKERSYWQKQRDSISKWTRENYSFESMVKTFKNVLLDL